MKTVYHKTLQMSRDILQATLVDGLRNLINAQYQLPKLAQPNKHLFPCHCLLCKETTDYPSGICQRCTQTLPWLVYRCKCCALPLPNAAAERSLCGHCQSDTPSFDATIALFHYKPPISLLTQRLKYQREFYLLRTINALFNEHLNAIKQLPQIDIVIPMPLHASRLRERGFNQALEMARPLARLLNAKLDYTSCQRIKKTSAQTTLRYRQRQSNVRNAFNVRGNFSGKTILVVDDVMTTGHTLRALCGAIKKAGALNIMTWVLARAT